MRALGEAALETIAGGYVYFVIDVNKEHLAYCRRGQYRAKSYAEVYEAVYDNDRYMQDYHWGVFATLVLWEHHLALCEFFERRFLDCHLADDCYVLELGSGTGVWSLLTARNKPSVRCEAVDISKSSFALATSLAEAAALADRLTFRVGDALSIALPVPARAGISCFLLEHLEAPDQLLRNMAANLEDGAPCFITAAVTAAEVDHIYEFRAETDLLVMMEQCGFRIVEVLSSSPPADLGFRHSPFASAWGYRKRHVPASHDGG